jgi:hypothetical protein
VHAFPPRCLDFGPRLYIDTMALGLEFDVKKAVLENVPAGY